MTFVKQFYTLDSGRCGFMKKRLQHLKFISANDNYGYRSINFNYFQRHHNPASQGGLKNIFAMITSLKYEK